MDSKFKLSEINNARNTSKFIKPFIEQKSNKHELSHSKPVEYIETKNPETFPVTKFREAINSFIGHLVEGQETNISEYEKYLDAKWSEFFEWFYACAHCKIFLRRQHQNNLPF